MKKLMIATAAAAIAGAGFADGVVYDMALNVKTTKAVNGKVSDKCGCYFGSVYRKQASYKVQGLFWGCDCYLPAAVLVDRDPFTGIFASGEGNYIFWNVTDKGVWADDTGYIEQDFAWNLLGRIGNKAAECEGAWTLNIGDLALMGAGFGKVDGCEESSIVKSMSGNFAGYWNPGQGCLRCADNAIGYWPLCECGEEDGLTAAYGTWNLKYNSAATKKFVKGQDFFKFPAYVLPAIAQFVEGGEDPDDPTSEKVATYKKAVAAYEQAKEDLMAINKEAWDFTAGGVAAAPAHQATSWRLATIGSLSYDEPVNVAWTYAMAAANVPYETELTQVALDTKTSLDLIAKFAVAPFNAINVNRPAVPAADGYAALPAGTVACIPELVAEMIIRRDCEDDIKNAKFALELKKAINYDYATDADGSKTAVTTAENALKVVYDPTAKVGGVDAKIDNVRLCKQAIDDLITTSALTDAQKAEARKAIADFEAAFEVTAAAKDAWEDAINERAKIQAGMTAAEAQAKADELNKKLAEAGELVNVKLTEMAAAKAVCGKACDDIK